MIEIDELPKNWEIKELDEVGDVISGGTPSTKVEDYWNGNISWITPADLSGYKNKIINVGRKSITEKGLQNSSARLMPKGSVLFSSRAPIGYVAIAGKSLCTNQGFKSIVPNEFVICNYLYYFLKYARKEINEAASGTTFKEISASKFSNIKIPIPPINEQNRIVEKIEELFSELDKGNESLKTAQQQLKVYRQAVLKWAFEGKLTEFWRDQQQEKLKGNIQDRGKLNRKVLLDEGESFELPDLPKGWNWVKLCDMTEKIFDGPFGSNLKTNDYVECGVRVIRLENIGVLEFKDDYKTYVNKEKYQSIKNHTVHKGDIIFSSFIAENIRVSIIPEFIDYAINKADCFCIRPLIEVILNKYLCYFLSTRAFYSQLVNEVHGATRPRINTTQLKNGYIPICALKEQIQIVQEVESRLSVCDKIEETIEQSLKQAEALRQSILKKAFEGKLVPQDPNDEPASKLLERIRAAKQATEKLTTKKSKLKIQN